MTTCSRADAGAWFNYPFLTQKERDNETGLDNFLARYYSSSQGRFTSADEPFAGQDRSDPQTWNLYSYTSNNPLNRVDEDGQRWFYRQTKDGWDVEWVDPNNDGSYTAPAGTGWRGFIPSRENGFSLIFYSADGYKAYYFNEKPDGSPRVEELWTAKTENRPEHMILGVDLARGVAGLAGAALRSFVASRAAKAAAEAAASAAERLPSLSGVARNEAKELLKKNGFQNRGTTPGGYEKWYHPDGSRIQIRPNGEVVRTAPKISPSAGGPKYRPRVGPDGKPTSSHNTGEKVSGR